MRFTLQSVLVSIVFVSITFVSQASAKEFTPLASVLSPKVTVVSPTALVVNTHTLTSEAKKSEPKVKTTFIGNISAYTAAADECGKSDGITASGKKVTANRTLACPKNYKFGTKVVIEGIEYTCEDRGGAIKGNKFDIYVETKKEAFAFGRKKLEVSIIQ